MKINGEKPAEMSSGPSCVVTDSNWRKAPLPPKLLAREEGGEKLMRSGQSGNKALPAPSSLPRELSWFPYRVLASMVTALFPNDRQRTNAPPSESTTPATNGASLSFDEQPDDQRIVHRHKINITRHFTDTWASRLPHHQQQLEQGSYLLVQASGKTCACTSYPDFAKFVGGDMPDLPERILHIAGPQLANFLCQTYLYNPALPLCGHIGQQRVEPLVNLRTKFEIARNQDGQVQVRYTAGDEHINRVMLVGPSDYDEHDAELLSPASICFSGTLLFSSQGDCAIGPVQVRSTAMRLHKQVALP